MTTYNELKAGALFTFDIYEGTSREGHIFTKGVFKDKTTGRECNGYCKKHNYYMVFGDKCSVSVVE